jgi:hypothetical protein|tara:strand:- start:20478 stop:21098 length:621 start_codon:yes stop_codon:yes gene_type:complete
MASAGQFKNKVKVIAVANIGAAFKKAKIVQRIIASAKAKGHVAKGQLVNPKTSRSITPFSDDRWLIRKDAVKVKVVELPSQEFAVTSIRVQVRYGLNGKYKALSSKFAGKKAWMPPVNAIANWIRAKQSKGQFQDVSEKNVRRVAFGIALKIKKKGIKKTSFANHFFNKTNGVQATLNKGMNNTTKRLDVLYATSVERSLTKMIQL